MQEMLPTPSTSHVDFARVYEPAEDSYLLLDTLSSEPEKTFLHRRFNGTPNTSPPTTSATPFVVEIGSGSGVVLSFIHSHVEIILGRPDAITAGVDVNPFACKATSATISSAEAEQTPQAKSHAFYLGNVLGDLANPIRMGQVDVLIFNPPYVPTAELPSVPMHKSLHDTTFEDDSHFLELSYAGGADGMETTYRLLDALPSILSRDRGCAYILLCAQNKPDDVKDLIRNWGNGWQVETVGRSGKRAGWENLQVIRIWR